MKRISACTVVLLLLLVPCGQVSAWSDDEGTRGPGPLNEVTDWYDGLDDTSNVYVPPGGLVGVEVSGGEAALLPGHDQGWIASSIIACPEGYRYDLVVLEVETPGNSWVNISVLDPSKASSDDAFANATVPGFVNMTGPDASVFRVPVSTYPGIRLQVSMHADGSDRPRLLSWGLRFIDLGQWRDDFIGLGKMVASAGLNLTSGQVMLDLSGGVGGEGEAFPPVLFPDGRGDVDIFFSNDNEDGYDDSTTITGTSNTGGIDAGDLNGDGYFDIILARDGVSGSMLLWGSDSGKWSTSDSQTLTHTDTATDAAIGDFDGDGHTDFVLSALGGMWHDGSYVWLNNGDGTFNQAPDIKLDGGTGHVDAGDLNNDGYDDIVLTKSLVMDAACYYGGPNGPDNTADLNFLRGISMTPINQVLVEDIDGDDYLDVLFAVFDNSKVPIFLGGASGPDVNADYSLDVNSIPWDMATGDLNADGYLDLVYTTGNPGLRNNRIEIFKGGASGWSALSKQTILMGPDPRAIEVLDIDKDGYDDILCGESATFKVFFGDDAWPTAADVTKSGLTDPSDMVVASTKAATVTFSGGFVSEPIPLPTGMVWDVMYLDCMVPSECQVSITVLDDDGEVIPGLENVPGPAVDLRAIRPEGSVQVKVEMSSQSEDVTPTLDSVLVNWHRKDVWRDQFFGDIKSDSMLNLEERDLQLSSTGRTSDLPDLVFAGLRSDMGYDVKSTAFMDVGALDYLSMAPLEFNTVGATSVDAFDVNGDGVPDLAFSSYGTGPTSYAGESPVFLGSPAGWYDVPYHTFTTSAATDILMDDLDGDGHADVVIAQDLRAGPDIPSLLFWGSEDGWSSDPDVEFETEGAWGVASADLDDDGLADLVFASDVNHESLVFYQESAGFCGTAPDHELPTSWARDVDIGDLDDDGNLDLVFANHYDGVTYSIDSYVYWGQSGRGFDSSPTRLATMGASDVVVTDVDGDDDLDVIFANNRNATSGYRSEAGIYINDGSGGLTTTSMHYVGTEGAIAVTAVDLDGRGVIDLVFACRNNGTTFAVPSLGFVGPYGSWPLESPLLFPTVGALDVMSVRLSDPARGGYVSEAITPDPVDDPGAYNILMYTASIAAGQTGTVSLLDASTGDMLASTPLLEGHNEWDVSGMVSYRDHPSIRVEIEVMGLVGNPGFSLDDLRLNWTERTPMAPEIVSIGISNTTVYRGDSVVLSVAVHDEFDLPGELILDVEHQLADETDWRTFLVGEMTVEEGVWNVNIAPDRFVPVGEYALRVNVTDSDGLHSGPVVLDDVLTVMPNLPMAPNLLRADPSDRAVELEWRAPHDTGDLPLLGFRILRGPTEDEMLVIDSTDSFSDTYNDTGLTNGLTYFYAIVAYNDLGNSPPSVVLNATPRGVPGYPLDLSVETGDGSVTLSWTAPAMDGGSAVLGYRVFRGLQEDQLEEVASLGVTTSYLDVGLTNGEEYFYSVLAFNELGDGSGSEVLSAIPLGLPEPPTGLTIEVSVMRLTLSWEPPVDTGGSALSGFIILRGTTKDSLELHGTMPASASEYVDEDLSAGQMYFYAVAAETAAGAGSPSIAISAMAMDVPDAPGDLSATSGDGVVHLSWTAPYDGGSPIVGYIVRRQGDGDVETFRVGEDTSFSDISVVNGRTYSYTVRAESDIGEGRFSDPVEASPTAPVLVPDRVSYLAVSSKEGRVTVTWTPPDDDGGSVLTGYVIFRGDSADTMSEIASVGLVTSFVDEDVVAGKTYFYSVSAVNAVGAGDASDPVSIQIQRKEGDDDGLPPLLLFGIVLMLIAVIIGWVVRPRLQRD
ncbi:MAG: fibronectin type III domain-containing protein [Thermoplasmata archaeon]|nr:MAG: fibronectin type III domain-containing protein [Thermoplasmata archaeon]